MGHQAPPADAAGEGSSGAYGKGSRSEARPFAERNRPGLGTEYGEAVNSPEMRSERYLPEGLVEGCRLVRNIAKDEVIRYDDVTLPPGRIADSLREEQHRHFPIADLVEAR